MCQPKVPPNLQGYLSPAHYDDFAEEVGSMVEYARIQAHIDFDYFSPFNETDCYPPEGPRIDPDEAPKVLEAVAQRLKKEGLGDVQLAVADNAIITNDYTDPILKDDELMKQVGVFTFHTYGENSIGAQVDRVKASKYARVPVWLTEYGDLNDEDKTFENQWKNFSLKSNRRALTALNQGANALFYFDAFDDYEECARRLCFYGLFRSASHVYSPEEELLRHAAALSLRAARLAEDRRHERSLRPDRLGFPGPDAGRAGIGRSERRRPGPLRDRSAADWLHACELGSLRDHPRIGLPESHRPFPCTMAARKSTCPRRRCSRSWGSRGTACRPLISAGPDEGRASPTPTPRLMVSSARLSSAALSHPTRIPCGPGFPPA